MVVVAEWSSEQLWCEITDTHDFPTISMLVQTHPAHPFSLSFDCKYTVLEEDSEAGVECSESGGFNVITLK